MNVHAKVQTAKKKGTLVPGPCEICATTDNVEAHHDDKVIHHERRKKMKYHRLDMLQMHTNWRDTAFDRVSVHSKGKPIVSLLGVCYGDLSLNCCLVADAAADLCGTGFYGLDTYRKLTARQGGWRPS